MTEPGAVLRGLTVGDDPAVWDQLGFAVHGGRVHLGGVEVRLDGARAGGGLLGWTLDPSPAGALDGLPHVASDVASPSVSASTTSSSPDPVHPNGITGVDHVVVATGDHDRTAAALAGHGLHPRRTVDGARGDTATRYRFYLLGTCLLEVIGPTEPRADAGPARFVGLALVADDLERLGDHAGTPRAAVQPGRRIVTLRTEPLGGSLPIAVLTPRR